jgi:hypothetical protein
LTGIFACAQVFGQIQLKLRVSDRRDASDNIMIEETQLQIRKSTVASRKKCILNLNSKKSQQEFPEQETGRKSTRNKGKGVFSMRVTESQLNYHKSTQ